MDGGRLRVALHPRAGILSLSFEREADVLLRQFVGLSAYAGRERVFTLSLGQGQGDGAPVTGAKRVLQVIGPVIRFILLVNAQNARVNTERLGQGPPVRAEGVPGAGLPTAHRARADANELGEF